MVIRRISRLQRRSELRENTIPRDNNDNPWSVCVPRHSSKNRVAIVLALWLIGILITTGQVLAQTEIPDDLQIKIGQFDASKYPEITIFINVTDSSGKNVSGLVKEDFIVSEDDRTVEVVNFAGIGDTRLVDIVFVFDTTGSMEEEIEGVVSTSKQFADELETKGRNYRLGLVTFADVVLQVQRTDDTLTEDAEEFKGWVDDLEAEGGDDDPENDYAAIKRAMQMYFRDGSQNIFILITDAPPHHHGDSPDGGNEFDDPDLDYQRILDMLNEKSISVYAVAPAHDEFVSLTKDTGGNFYDIQENPDFTGLIEEIGETIANQYRITYRSPRPTYDGTRRDVKISVGEADATTAYAEKHLLTVESNCLVGLLCLLPLLAALAIPVGSQTLMRYIGEQAESPTPEGTVDSAAPGMVSEQSSVSEAVPAQMDRSPSAIPAAAPAASPACLGCGSILELGVRFCTVCGQPVSSAQPSPPMPFYEARECPKCGNIPRPGVNFCNRCGFKL